MARVNTYLNFPRKTEEAFLFYKSVFGGEFTGGGVARFSDIPSIEGALPIAEEDKNLIMHIELPLIGGHINLGVLFLQKHILLSNIASNSDIVNYRQI